MLAAPSTLSLVAAGFYVAVAFVGASACSRAVLQRQAAWHGLAWALIVAVFLGFALMRVFAVEEWLRSDLREMLYERHSYEQRRVLQEPLTVLIIVGAAGAAAWITYFVMTSVKGRRNVALITALGCSGGLIVLAAFRVISLHFIDDLLYGPLKLNWCLDLGLSFSVLACGVRYRLVVGVRPG